VIYYLLAKSRNLSNRFSAMGVNSMLNFPSAISFSRAEIINCEAPAIAFITDSAEALDSFVLLSGVAF
jgi:hypothetical protein